MAIMAKYGKFFKSNLILLDIIYKNSKIKPVIKYDRSTKKYDLF